MSLFLQVVSVSKAIEVIRTLAVRCGDEPVPLVEALHRILAEDVRADVDIPGFTRSVVDGYAVRAADHGFKRYDPLDVSPSWQDCYGNICRHSPPIG
jgi:molybdopterin biosynthesis enzyme